MFANFVQFPVFHLILTILNHAYARSTPPMEFPKNESIFPFVHNNEIVKALLNRSEVDDLRKPTDEEFVKTIHGIKQGSAKQPQEDKKWQTELIEDGSNTEEVVKNKEELNNANSAEVQGQIGVIIAGAVVVIAIVAYAGFLSWRRRRMMGRRMLVNEDDFFEPSDMRDFTI